MRSLDRVIAFLPDSVRAAFEDPSVSELMLNGPGSCWLEREGRLDRVEAPDLTEDGLRTAAVHIARPLGLQADATDPLVDARLEDGSRVAIALPPAAPTAAITIRRFGARQFTTADLVELGSLPPEVLAEAAGCLRERRNVLVAGGTGSGKTTLLQALVGLIPADERLLVIEDTLELHLTAPNCLRLEARGLAGGVTIRDLVRHSLRHRPDRVILGEVRGGEARDLLQALNTGHGGSMSTIHANDAEGALVRLASCALEGGAGVSWGVLCLQVAQAIDLVVHIERRNGRRGVSEAVRVDGACGDGWRLRRVWPAPAEAR